MMPHEIESGFRRLFVAIVVPLAVRGEIARAQSQLRRAAPPGALRWASPEQFHLTLKFLGDVPVAQVDAVQKAAAVVCAGLAPTRISARGLGFFPNERKPRVLWVGAGDDNRRLPELHRQLDEALRPFAPSEKAERFTGHLTLGRFKPGWHGVIEHLMKRVELLRNHPFGDWLATEVELIRSELTPQGATHTVISTFPLSAAQVGDGLNDSK